MPCLAAFAALARSKVTALIQGSDPLFTDRRKHIVALTISHRIPTMFFERKSVIEGGLMTYAASFTDSFRQVGVCVGSILKGPSLPNFQFSSRPSSKRTWPSALQMSAFGGKADMTFCTAHVCF